MPEPILNSENLRDAACQMLIYNHARFDKADGYFFFILKAMYV